VEKTNGKLEENGGKFKFYRRSESFKKWENKAKYKQNCP
jgi:hypothetical protein